MILTKKKFTNSVEELVIQKHLTYIDAIVHFCQENHLEPDSVKGLDNSSFERKDQSRSNWFKILKE